MTTPRRTTKKTTASTPANADAVKTDEVTTENNETATTAPSDTADKQPTPAEIEDGPSEDNDEESGSAKDNDEESDSAEESEPVIRVEVVHGGAMVAGRPREKGAKIELRGRQISDTKDRNGDSWIDILDDSDAQVKKYGKVLFKSY